MTAGSSPDRNPGAAPGTASRSEFTRPAVLATLAAMVGMSAGPTPMVSAVAGLFMKPLSQEFGLNRTTISVILLLSPLAVAVCSPIGGRMLDRFGVRRVLLPCVVLFACANAAMLLVHALWQYLVLAVVISACVAVHCYSSYTKVITLWFARHRGVVTGVAIAGGSGLGAAIIPQLVQPWIAHFGWRWAYAGIGAIVLLWAVPALFLFLREPVDVRTVADKALADDAVEGLSRAEAMRAPAFWLIAAAMYLAPLTIVGTLGHLFPMLTERGASPRVATTALSFIYIGGMIGQLSSGYLLDRVSSPKIVLPYFAAALIGVAITHRCDDPRWILPGAVLLGLGQGSEMSILAYLTARYFGIRNYCAIYGRLYGFANLGIATGLVSMGVAHDRYGSYAPMIYVFLAALLGVLALFASLPAYRFRRAGLALG
jgi:MFS family permease